MIHHPLTAPPFSHRLATLTLLLLSLSMTATAQPLSAQPEREFDTLCYDIEKIEEGIPGTEERKEGNYMLCQLGLMGDLKNRIAEDPQNALNICKQLGFGVTKKAVKARQIDEWWKAGSVDRCLSSLHALMKEDAGFCPSGITLVYTQNSLQQEDNERYKVTGCMSALRNLKSLLHRKSVNY
jgi:hypothetical protein